MRVTVGSAVGCNGAVTGVDDMSAIFRNRVLGRHKDESKIKKESFGVCRDSVGPSCSLRQCLSPPRGSGSLHALHLGATMGSHSAITTKARHDHQAAQMKVKALPEHDINKCQVWESEQASTSVQFALLLSQHLSTLRREATCEEQPCSLHRADGGQVLHSRTILLR